MGRRQPELTPPAPKPSPACCWRRYSLCLAESDRDDLVRFRTARGGDLDAVALALANQRARQGRGYRQSAGFDVGFVLADNLECLLLVGFLIREGDFRTKFDDRTRQLGDVDNLRPCHFILEFDDPAFDKALPVAGRVVLRVFGQISVVASLGDGAANGRPVNGLQPLQLLPEPIEALGRHRDLVHRRRVRTCCRMSNTAAGGKRRRGAIKGMIAEALLQGSRRATPRSPGPPRERPQPSYNTGSRSSARCAAG